MSLISSTLGRFVPKYRTLAQWEPIYAQIVASRDIVEKTKENRRTHRARIVTALGRRTISAIRPHEIAGLIKSIAAMQPHTALRTLVEARDMFNEALQHGWVDTNPAVPVKLPRVRVARERLSFDQWQRIHDHSDACSPPWVSRMLVLALVTGQRRGDLRKMRFSDVCDEHLRVEQQKTGARLELPLDLQLGVIGVSIREAIESCRGYAPLDADGDGYLLRKTTGGPLVGASLSWRFEQAREGALPPHSGKGAPPSLHECRSLAERLYREQGINTMILLGHSRQAMTDMYNRDRGLSRRAGKWKRLVLGVPPTSV